jgi:hypothetical protein
MDISVRLIFVALGILFLDSVFGRLFDKWNSWRQSKAQEVEQLRGGAYLPPKPSWFGALVMFRLCRLARFLLAGPTTFYGLDRVRGLKGCKMLALKHTDPADVGALDRLLLAIADIGFFGLIKRIIFNRKDIPVSRYMIDTNVLKGWFGWFALITGAIAVFKEDDALRAKSAANAIKALKEDGPDATLEVFYEGTLVEDQQVHEELIKMGFLLIAKKFVHDEKKPMEIIPVGFHDLREPQDATLFHRAVMVAFLQVLRWRSLLYRIGLKKVLWQLSKFRRMCGYRNYGMIVVVGKPLTFAGKDTKAEQVLRGTALPSELKEALAIFIRKAKILQRTAKRIGDRKRKLRK